MIIQYILDIYILDIKDHIGYWILDSGIKMNAKVCVYFILKYNENRKENENNFIT